MHPGVTGRQSIVDAKAGGRAACWSKAGEHKIRHSPVERVGRRDARIVDARESRDVFAVREGIGRFGHRVSQVDAEVVERSAVSDVEHDRRDEPRVRRVAAKIWKHVERLSLFAPVLDLPVQDDGGAPSDAGAAGGLAAASGSGGTLPGCARKVLRQTEAHRLGRRVRRG